MLQRSGISSLENCADYSSILPLCERKKLMRMNKLSWKVRNGLTWALRSDLPYRRRPIQKILNEYARENYYVEYAAPSASVEL
jgi:hypothetical protein